jgi:hypothetical protein
MYCINTYITSTCVSFIPNTEHQARDNDGWERSFPRSRYAVNSLKENSTVENSSCSSAMYLSCLVCKLIHEDSNKILSMNSCFFVMLLVIHLLCRLVYIGETHVKLSRKLKLNPDWGHCWSISLYFIIMRIILLEIHQLSWRCLKPF